MLRIFVYLWNSTSITQQILSLHHVNTPVSDNAVIAISGGWSMMLTLQSTLSLIFQRLDCETKLETTSPVATKQSQYHYWPNLNKQMARYQAIFIPSERVQEMTTEIFCFFWGAKQRDLETQTEETIVPSAMRGHNAVQLPSRIAFQNTSMACVLEAGRIFKLFPRVDRRIQGSGLTQRLWPKAAQEAWECHASTQSCTVVTGKLLVTHKALWPNYGFSRLIFISGIVS